MQKYACLIFIRDLQEATQQDTIIVSQVAAEKLSEKKAKEAAAKVPGSDDDDRIESFSEGHESDDDDDEVNGGGAIVTETAKTEKPGKGVKGKKERPPSNGEYFTGTGAVHCLIRRTTVFWLNAPAAHDFCEPSSHSERLRCGLAAVQGFNLGGLRDIAPGLFLDDFMRTNFTHSSSSADKVKTFYMHAAT